MKKRDIRFPREDRYPNWLIFAALGGGVPSYIFFAILGDPSRGLAAALSVGVIISVIITLWNLRTYWQFWFQLVLNILFHAEIVRIATGFDTHFPGIILAPLFIIDLLFWQLITVLMIRLLGRARNIMPFEGPADTLR